MPADSSASLNQLKLHSTERNQSSWRRNDFSTGVHEVTKREPLIASDCIRRLRQPKRRQLQRIQLRHQACLPSQVLPGRVFVAVMPVVDEKQVVDAFRIRRAIGAGLDRLAGLLPGGQAAFQQQRCLGQFQCGPLRQRGFIGHQHHLA